MSVSWSLVLMLGWLGIAAARLGMLLTAAVQVRVWARRADSIDDPRLWQMLDECRERMRVTKLVDLRNSEACSTPLVVGFRQPTILLPSAVLERLDEAELRSVFIHELNHVKRWDGVVNVLQGVLGAIYFFHPLVWLANNHIRKLREDACDELTVAQLDGQRKPYGSAIVKVAEILGYAAPPLALGVLDSKTPARRRLERILDPKLPNSSGSPWLAATAVVLLGAILLPGGPSPAREREVALIGHEGNRNERNRNERIESELKGARRGQPVQQLENDKEVKEGPAPRVENPLVAEPVGSLSDLKYGWELGRRYMYEVRIEADLGDVTEVMKGYPTFTPKSREFG